MKNIYKLKRKVPALFCAFLAIAIIFLSLPMGAYACEYRGTDGNFYPFNNICNNDSTDVVVASRFGELLFGEKKEKPLMLCPGGEVLGVKISGSGVVVSRVLTDNEGGLMEEDKILSIEGRQVFSTEEVKSILKECGDTASLEIIRNGKSMKLKVTLATEASDLRLGVLLSDISAGIGTVTYINPESGEFGGLGHGICDGGRGNVLPMKGGTVSGVILGGATRGETGKPGELRGILTHEELGELYSNTPCGVFGKFNSEGIAKKCTTEPIPVGERATVTPGEAEIISTVKSGRRATYKIEIFDIDYSSRGSKSFKIKITDSELIALTGGIVRGMSGSPIIQNGRLIGAVTHVMLSDAKEGYGIFIENMLSAAEGSIDKAA